MAHQVDFEIITVELFRFPCRETDRGSTEEIVKMVGAAIQCRILTFFCAKTELGGDLYFISIRS